MFPTLNSANTYKNLFFLMKISAARREKSLPLRPCFFCYHLLQTQTELLRMHYLPPANEVWGKVKCLQVCVCPQGGVPGPGGAWWRPPPNGYCCRRYASYWNAFLLNTIFTARRKLMFSEASVSRSVHEGWRGGEGGSASKRGNSTISMYYMLLIQHTICKWCLSYVLSLQSSTAMVKCILP